MNKIIVKFAVYGALNGGNENLCQTANVVSYLQTAIDNNDAIVTIDNSTMGGDPSPGNVKHFGAIICQGREERFYAGGEGQTLDFN